MPLSLRERRELRREARDFLLAYARLNPNATKAEVKAAAEQHFRGRPGFDPTTLLAFLKIIAELWPIIVALFR